MVDIVSLEKISTQGNVCLEIARRCAGMLHVDSKERGAENSRMPEAIPLYPQDITPKDSAAGFQHFDLPGVDAEDRHTVVRMVARARGVSDFIIKVRTTFPNGSDAVIYKMYVWGILEKEQRERWIPFGSSYTTDPLLAVADSALGISETVSGERISRKPIPKSL